jgi:hypothetical protein
MAGQVHKEKGGEQMHLEGRSDKSVTISEEEYELLLIYKMQVETLLLGNKNAPCIEGCNRAKENNF